MPSPLLPLPPLPPPLSIPLPSPLLKKTLKTTSTKTTTLKNPNDNNEKVVGWRDQLEVYAFFPMETADFIGRNMECHEIIGAYTSTF